MSTILNKLQGLSAAEEFFAALDVPFEQAVLNVSRLHILKRFNENMARAKVAEMVESDQFEACQTCLASAYSDFLTSSGVKEKMFKVFKDQAPSTGFVSIDQLKTKR
ncbi:MAG: nitrogenase-stabilizing/protective protein NifW [Alphaproteobacteria bacterium]|nr:nitrogenase-stabilizing/protective protein NifW [Alphaproteobacteria bacterium]